MLLFNAKVEFFLHVFKVLEKNRYHVSADESTPCLSLSLCCVLLLQLKYEQWDFTYLPRYPSFKYIYK